jgi:hypothetical protein
VFGPGLWLEGLVCGGGGGDMAQMPRVASMMSGCSLFAMEIGLLSSLDGSTRVYVAKSSSALALEEAPSPAFSVIRDCRETTTCTLNYLQR